MKVTTNVLLMVALLFAVLTAALSDTNQERILPDSGTQLTQAEAARRLSAAGITSSSTGGCTDRGRRTCTSYEGVLSGTVDGAITLKRACACDILITGGTEVGHSNNGPHTHANGFKFDFRKNARLDPYVKNTFTRIANRGDGFPQWRSAAGNIYCDEGNHWDVTYL